MSNTPQVTLLSHSGKMMSHGGNKTVTSYEIYLNDIRLRGYSTHGNMEEGYWGVAAHRLAREYAEAVAATLGVRVVRARSLPKPKPKPDVEDKRCPAKKMGEFNWLRCCCDKDHTGDHNYIVDGPL